ADWGGTGGAFCGAGGGAGTSHGLSGGQTPEISCCVAAVGSFDSAVTSLREVPAALRMTAI
ncbi:MAG: hypothetical protein WBQ68_21335, partial [Terriglobales bacterium]